MHYEYGRNGIQRRILIRRGNGARAEQSEGWGVGVEREREKRRRF